MFKKLIFQSVLLCPLLCLANLADDFHQAVIDADLNTINDLMVNKRKQLDKELGGNTPLIEAISLAKGYLHFGQMEQVKNITTSLVDIVNKGTTNDVIVDDPLLSVLHFVGQVDLSDINQKNARDLFENVAVAIINKNDAVLNDPRMMGTAVAVIDDKGNPILDGGVRMYPDSTIFSNAAHARSTKKVLDLMVKKDKDFINPSRDPYTLELAMGGDSIDYFKFMESNYKNELLKALNTRNHKDGETPIRFALVESYISIVKLAIELDPTILTNAQSKDLDGNVPLDMVLQLNIPRANMILGTDSYFHLKKFYTIKKNQDKAQELVKQIFGLSNKGLQDSMIKYLKSNPQKLALAVDGYDKLTDSEIQQHARDNIKSIFAFAHNNGVDTSYMAKAILDNKIEGIVVDPVEAVFEFGKALASL